MVAVLNRMLERLERRWPSMQRFTADAAHELRTPLTVLRTGLEVDAGARTRVRAEYRAALGEALDDDRAARPPGRGPADPGAPRRRCRRAARRRADRCRRDAARARRRHGAGARRAARPRDRRRRRPALNVHGTAADLYRLFGNLIDNALRHSRAGGSVAVAARRATACEASASPTTAPASPPTSCERVFDASSAAAPSRRRRRSRPQHRPRDRPRPRRRGAAGEPQRRRVRRECRCRWRSASHHENTEVHASAPTVVSAGILGRAARWAGLGAAYRASWRTMRAPRRARGRAPRDARTRAASSAPRP